MNTLKHIGIGIIAGVVIGFLLCMQVNKPDEIVITKTKTDTLRKSIIIPGIAINIPYAKPKTEFKKVIIESDFVEISSKTFSDFVEGSSTFTGFEFIGYLQDSIDYFTEYPINFIGTNLFLSPPFQSIIDTNINGNNVYLSFLYGSKIRFDSISIVTKSYNFDYNEFTKTNFYYRKPWYYETWFEVTKDLLIAGCFAYIGTQIR